MTALPRAAWKPREIAEMFGMDYDFVLEQIRSGAIEAEKFGTTYRVPNAWVQMRRGSDLLDNDLLAAMAVVLKGAAEQLAEYLPVEKPKRDWRRSA